MLMNFKMPCDTSRALCSGFPISSAYFPLLLQDLRKTRLPGRVFQLCSSIYHAVLCCCREPNHLLIAMLRLASNFSRDRKASRYRITQADWSHELCILFHYQHAFTWLSSTGDNHAALLARRQCTMRFVKCHRFPNLFHVL